MSTDNAISFIRVYVDELLPSKNVKLVLLATLLTNATVPFVNVQELPTSIPLIAEVELNERIEVELLPKEMVLNPVSDSPLIFV